MKVPDSKLASLDEEDLVNLTDKQIKKALGIYDLRTKFGRKLDHEFSQRCKWRWNMLNCVQWWPRDDGQEVR